MEGPKSDKFDLRFFKSSETELTPANPVALVLSLLSREGIPVPAPDFPSSLDQATLVSCLPDEDTADVVEPGPLPPLPPAPPIIDVCRLMVYACISLALGIDPPPGRDAVRECTATGNTNLSAIEPGDGLLEEEEDEEGSAAIMRMGRLPGNPA